MPPAPNSATRTAKAIGLYPEFVIIDSDDQVALIKRNFEILNLDPKQHNPSSVLTAISHSKSKMITPSEYTKKGRSYFEEIVGRIYERIPAVAGRKQGARFRRPAG